MDEQEKYPGRRPGRIGAGLVLLLVGTVLLLDQMGFPLPDWLFNWHVLLIVIGIFLGFRHGFRGGAWLILILVGAYFFIQDYFPHLPLQRYLWPCMIIFFGILFIVSPRRPSWRPGIRNRWDDDPRAGCGRRQWKRTLSTGFSSSKEGYSSEDFVDSTAVFAGIHKKIVSKNFQGGDITSFMGGTELDLTQADFSGVIRLDVTQLMGGTKLIVPPHWEVRSEVTAVFAGYEDKRQQPAVTNPDKVLIISGTSIFGGIELKNY